MRVTLHDGNQGMHAIKVTIESNKTCRFQEFLSSIECVFVLSDTLIICSRWRLIFCHPITRAPFSNISPVNESIGHLYFVW